MSPTTTRPEELIRKAKRHPMVTDGRVAYSPTSGFFCVNHPSWPYLGNLCDSCEFAAETNRQVTAAMWP